MSRVIKPLEQYIPINQIFALFKEDAYAVFLDSSLQNQLGQFSIIGIHPTHTIINGDNVLVNGKAVEMSFEEYMRNYLKENYEENTTNLPLLSGAIGYFSYDYGRKLEKVESIHKKEVDIPDCIFNFYDDFIIEDHQNRVVYLIANGKLIPAEEAIANLEKVIHNSTSKASKKEVNNDKCNTSITANFQKEEYYEALQNMIQYIIEGDIYIANMTQRLEILSPKKPYEVFEKLRTINPSPFGAYLNFEEFQVISASPERFLKMKHNHIETRPIKGTRKKGDTPEEDLALKEELQQSEKDKSELLMIVDLERNDLNKVCVEGSVKVTELYTVEEYATVYHLVANIVGELKKELTSMDLIQATFPGGSITGAPKKRAIEIIDELENGRRNIYTGSIGYLSLDGNCDFNIVIRTAIHKDGKYLLGVGGGITFESEVEFEYEETLQKAKAVLEALR